MLTVMHNLWIKEHNRIATIFSQITNWNDERIYQETRRIVGAELQQITYNEYLPIALGNQAMRTNDLWRYTALDHLFRKCAKIYSNRSTSWSRYNNRIDPTIMNEFATAAYRFGHSLIAGVVRLLNGQNSPAGEYLVGDEFFSSRQVTSVFIQ